MAASDVFEDPVGGDVDEDVENVEDRERDIVFVAGEFEIFDQTIKLRIT